MKKVYKVSKVHKVYKGGMKFEKFEDIMVWQKAQDLTIQIYKDFRYCHDYSFREQIQRAAVSIMNNIAEGYERKGNKEFTKFLYIAKGSSAEVRSMIYLCVEFKYLSIQNCRKYYALSIEISKMLSGLIKNLKE